MPKALSFRCGFGDLGLQLSEVAPHAGSVFGAWRTGGPTAPKGVGCRLPGSRGLGTGSAHNLSTPPLVFAPQPCPLPSPRPDLHCLGQLLQDQIPLRPPTPVQSCLAPPPLLPCSGGSGEQRSGLLPRASGSPPVPGACSVTSTWPSPCGLSVPICLMRLWMGSPQKPLKSRQWTVGLMLSRPPPGTGWTLARKVGVSLYSQSRVEAPPLAQEHWEGRARVSGGAARHGEQPSILGWGACAEMGDGSSCGRGDLCSGCSALSAQNWGPCPLQHRPPRSLAGGTAGSSFCR